MTPFARASVLLDRNSYLTITDGRATMQRNSFVGTQPTPKENREEYKIQRKKLKSFRTNKTAEKKHDRHSINSGQDY